MTNSALPPEEVLPLKRHWIRDWRVWFAAAITIVCLWWSMRGVPLDEVLVLVALDLGGRPYAVVKAAFDDPVIGDLPSDLVRHFLEVFALEARMNLHAQVLVGGNDHHKAEAIFKALARALRQALTVDPRVAEDVPSTKGTISD